MVVSENHITERCTFKAQLSYIESTDFEAEEYTLNELKMKIIVKSRAILK
jgi:hypothetical protein